MVIDKPLKNRASSPAIAVWAITPNGAELGVDISTRMGGACLFVSKTLETKLPPGSKHHSKGSDSTSMGVVPTHPFYTFDKLSEELSLQFFRFSAHVFIFSTGIAVRMIAPLIQSKTTDPAVVVLDDKGIHAISLLSGHLGGANELTRKIASLINGQAVITTATDVNHLPSIDLIAQENNLYIENPGAIKHVNMVFLKNGTMGVHDPGGFLNNQIPRKFIDPQACLGQGIGVICTWKTIKVPRETLILRPRNLSLGIGCNRNTSLEVIHDFLKKVFREEKLSLNAVFTLATTEVKHDETGLLALSEKLDLPVLFYDRNQLNSVDTIETPSLMVEKHLGVKSVCEAAAILAAKRGPLIVTKKKNKDVTIAVALKK